MQKNQQRGRNVGLQIRWFMNDDWAVVASDGEVTECRRDETTMTNSVRSIERMILLPSSCWVVNNRPQEKAPEGLTDFNTICPATESNLGLVHRSAGRYPALPSVSTRVGKCKRKTVRAPA